MDALKKNQMTVGLNVGIDRRDLLKNRAKCKLCQSVIESFHRHDFVTCKCGEISVDGGDQYMKCSARDWRNFLRVDDQGNEIVVTVKDAPDTDTGEKTLPEEKHKPTRFELLDMLSELIKNIESLPQGAMTTPVTHYDLLSSLMLLSEILRSE